MRFRYKPDVLIRVPASDSITPARPTASLNNELF